ncbi:MAG: polyphosphate kinase 2, partial [Lysobacteraceae bacterium]
NAPWTLVDFNDQKRGRLTLIRHLLDTLPDTALPNPEVKLPPLKSKPEKEHFGGPVKPIPNFDVD